MLYWYLLFSVNRSFSSNDLTNRRGRFTNKESGNTKDQMEKIKVKNKNIRIILSEVLLNSAFIIHQILNWKVAYGVLVLDSLLKYQPIKCQCCLHIETSQLICTSNQLTGFYIRLSLAFTGLIIKDTYCTMPWTIWQFSKFIIFGNLLGNYSKTWEPRPICQCEVKIQKVIYL